MIKDINLTIIDFEFKSMIKSLALCNHLTYNPGFNIGKIKQVDTILKEVDDHIENITLNNSKLNIELTNANSIIEKLKTELYNKTSNDIIEPESKVKYAVTNTNQECIELDKTNKVIISLREELANMLIYNTNANTELINSNTKLTNANNTIEELETNLKTILAANNKLSNEIIKSNDINSEYKTRIDNLLGSKFKLIQEKNTEVDNLTSENSKLVDELKQIKKELEIANKELKLHNVELNTTSNFKTSLKTIFLSFQEDDKKADLLNELIALRSQIKKIINSI